MVLSKQWTKMIDDGFADPFRWTWDGFVIAELGLYNRYLAATPRYIAVQPDIVIAMVWVESGGPKSSTWWGRVMQIGNPTDLGWPALKERKEATDIVVRAELLSAIDRASQGDLNNPAFNIQVGIAYLFVRMVMSDVRSVLEAGDASIHVHTVRPGDTASEIAVEAGTTLDELQNSNSNVNLEMLHAGQLLRFRKANMKRVVTGWRVFDAPTVASRYNGGGDTNYAEKLSYVLGKLRGT